MMRTFGRFLGRVLLVLLVAFVVFGPATVGAVEEPIPEKALCSVCALKGGETEEEKVKAHSTHEGQAYYFCSEGCKKEFDTDPAGYMPPVLPRPAPEIVVETLGGQDARLSDFAGKTVLLDFWATWCKPCVKMMPQLQKLQDAYADKGLVVAGVSIDEGKDRVKKIERFLKKVKVSYPIFTDAKENPAWNQFKVKAIPAVFLIDADGQIVAQWTGEVDHATIKDALEGRLGEMAAVKAD